MKRYLEKLVSGKELSSVEAEAAMKIIMSGKATDAQIASFLTALRIRGESVSEIEAFARVLRDFSVKVKSDLAEELVDTCGTGGDCKNTFNISTTSAFVAAGAGVKIAKHGNRSVSSKSGSADVLEALGVNFSVSVMKVHECLDSAGICFFYAPQYHEAMRNVASARTEMGIRTVFNVLGPLVSPVGVKRQVYGVYDGSISEKLSEVLLKLGSTHSLVVHGDDGLDEITNTTQTRISELKDSSIKTYDIAPEDFGFTRASLFDLEGSDAQGNSEITRSILGGGEGPKRDVVLLNAAAAIYVGGKAKSLSSALSLAERSIDSGKALNALNKLIEVSNAL